MKSESIKAISVALAKFQGEVPNVKKSATNPFYKAKYAPLDTIWDTIKATLIANGLSVAQILDNDEGNAVLETILMHTSGEWMSGRYPVKGIKEDPQAYGSAITYARRYALSSILGIVTDEDTDANEHVTPPGKTTTEKPPAPTSDKKEHWCEKHNTNFFKTGNMKSYAHPIKDGNGNTTGWCHEPKEESPFLTDAQKRVQQFKEEAQAGMIV